MIICLATFIILLVGMIFWPFVRVFSRTAAYKLASAFRAALKCVSKRATFQKCEVRFEDRVKTIILKKIVVKYPNLIKTVAILIYIISTLVILLFLLGILALLMLIFTQAS